MNFPRYEFSKESQKELQEFLKAAQSGKHTNPFCNPVQNRIWELLLPLNSSVPTNYPEEEIIVIDSPTKVPTENKPELIQSYSNEDLTDTNNPSSSNDETEIHDVAFAIREHLGIQKHIPDTIRCSLMKSDEEALKQLFLILLENLTTEEVHDLGYCLEGDSVISAFCQFVLLPKLKVEYSDGLSSVVQKYTQDYPGVIKVKLISAIQEDGNCKGIIQCIYLSKQNFKDDFLRSLVFGIDQLNDNSVKLILDLLSNRCETDLLKKLINLQLEVCRRYSKDKSFGKLLLNTVQFLEESVIQVEQQIRHIIGSHSSIWRSKIENMVDSRCNDSMLSQSLGF